MKFRHMIEFLPSVLFEKTEYAEHLKERVKLALPEATKKILEKYPSPWRIRTISSNGGITFRISSIEGSYILVIDLTAGEKGLKVSARGNDAIAKTVDLRLVEKKEKHKPEWLSSRVGDITTRDKPKERIPCK